MSSSICSSYSEPPVMAFWKIEGLDVTPRSPCSRTRRSSAPLSIIPRVRLSSQ